MNDNVTFRTPTPRQLRAVRAWFGWTQADASEHLNISVTTIQTYENGTRETDPKSLAMVTVALDRLGVRFDGTSVVLPE